MASWINDLKIYISIHEKLPVKTGNNTTSATLLVETLLTFKWVFWFGASDSLYSPVTNTSLWTSSFKHLFWPGVKTKESEFTRVNKLDDIKRHAIYSEKDPIFDAESRCCEIRLWFSPQYYSLNGRRGTKLVKRELTSGTLPEKPLAGYSALEEWSPSKQKARCRAAEKTG